MKKKMKHGKLTLKSNKCNLPCDDSPQKTLHNDKSFVPLQKGDIIWVATRTAGGLWKGVLSGRTGWFRPSHTEPCSHGNGEGTQRRTPNPRRTPRKTKPRTVEEVLYRIGLEVGIFIVKLGFFLQIQIFLCFGLEILTFYFFQYDVLLFLDGYKNSFFFAIGMILQNFSLKKTPIRKIKFL